MGVFFISAVACTLMAMPLANDKSDAPKTVTEIVSKNIENGFSGAILVKWGNETLLDTAAGEQIDTSSRFWIASVGKTFVSAAILKLVDEGTLSLDRSIADYLPSVPADKRPITIRQLLAHASGLPQSYVAETAANKEEALNLLLALPLEVAPGERFIYSNANYQLAAALVESVTSRSYDEHLKSLVDLATLTSTGRAGWPGTREVTPVNGELPERLTRLHWGEQGVFSTTHDLARWYEALADGQFLSKESVDALFSPVVPISIGDSGLGWFLTKTESGRHVRFVRGNEDFGANALIYAWPDENVVVVVLTHAGNRDDELSWSRAVLADIENQLFQGSEP